MNAFELKSDPITSQVPADGNERGTGVLRCALSHFTRQTRVKFERAFLTG